MESGQYDQKIWNHVQSILYGTKFQIFFSIIWFQQDWILMGVLDSFRVLQKSVGLKKYPEYNSMIIMELWKTGSGEHVVKMFYKAEEETQENHKLIDLTDSVRNCDGFKDGCPLDVSVTILDTTYELDCRNSSNAALITHMMFPWRCASWVLTTQSPRRHLCQSCRMHYSETSEA